MSTQARAARTARAFRSSRSIQRSRSIPRTNRERRLIVVKDGTYTEKVRVDAPFITLRGESRTGTRLEFAQARTESRDDRGVGVLNLGATANDFVLENLTVKNTHGVLGVHAPPEGEDPPLRRAAARGAAG